MWEKMWYRLIETLFFIEPTLDWKSLILSAHEISGSLSRVLLRGRFLGSLPNSGLLLYLTNEFGPTDVVLKIGFRNLDAVSL